MKLLGISREWEKGFIMTFRGTGSLCQFREFRWFRLLEYCQLIKELSRNSWEVKMESTTNHCTFPKRKFRQNEICFILFYSDMNIVIFSLTLVHLLGRCGKVGIYREILILILFWMNFVKIGKTSSLFVKTQKLQKNSWNFPQLLE